MSERAWHNFDTGETDYIEGTPKDLRPYLQDVAGSRNLFNLLVEMGKEPHEVFINISMRLIGEIS